MIELPKAIKRRVAELENDCYELDPDFCENRNPCNERELCEKCVRDAIDAKAEAEFDDRAYEMHNDPEDREP